MKQLLRYETEEEYRARLAEKQREYRLRHDRSAEHISRTAKRRRDRATSSSNK